MSGTPTSTTSTSASSSSNRHYKHWFSEYSNEVLESAKHYEVGQPPLKEKILNALKDQDDQKTIVKVAGLTALAGYVFGPVGVGV